MEDKTVTRRRFLGGITAGAGAAITGATAISTSSGTAKAVSTPYIIDDFEDGDVSEYSSYNTNTWSATTASAYSGTYGGELANSTGGGTTAVNIDNPENPQQGYTWEYLVNVQNDGCNVAMGWAVQSDSQAPSGYWAHLSLDNETLSIEEGYSGSSTTLASTSYTIPTNSWLRIEVVWNTDDSMTVTLYDDSGTQLAQVSATDGTYTGGYISYMFGFGGSGGGDTVYVDDVVITEDRTTTPTPTATATATSTATPTSTSTSDSTSTTTEDDGSLWGGGGGDSDTAQTAYYIVGIGAMLAGGGTALIGGGDD